MLRSMLLLGAIVSMATLTAALECFSCGQVHDKPSETQMESFKRVIEKLHMGSCHVGTYKECKSKEDECQKVEVQSYLGDSSAAIVHATVYKCGQKIKRDRFCRTLKLSGMLLAHVHLDYCEVEGCDGDKCVAPPNLGFEQ